MTDKLDEKLGTDDGLIYTPVPGNFVYPEIAPTTHILGVSGSGLIDDPILREDGDWRDYVPPEEEQNKYGVESSNCYIEANQDAIAIIQEEQHGLPDQDYSGRYNANYTDGSPQGGDPLKAGQSFRDQGLIPEAMLPFSSDIKSWREFVSFKGGSQQQCELQGKVWREDWDPKYAVVFEKWEPVATKYEKLRERLKRGPVPLSVYGWVFNPKTGLYEKPAGVNDQHLVVALYVDKENRVTIWDSYRPFTKTLAPMYNFDFAMKWTLIDNRMVVKKKIGILQQLVGLYQKLLALFVIPKPMQPDLPEDLVGLFCEAIKNHEEYVLPGAKYRDGSVAPNGSRSYRNKNPGNCKYSSVGYDPKYGKVGRDPDNFAIFPTVALGNLYLRNFITQCFQGKVARYSPTMTITQFFEVYSPDKNPDVPRNYARVVAKAVGRSVDDVISSLLA